MAADNEFKDLLEQIAPRIPRDIFAKYKNVKFDRCFEYSDDDTIDEYIKYASNLQAHKLYTGWYTIDKAIGGIRPGQVCTIIAAPNIGKTSCGLNVCYQQIYCEGDSIVKSGRLIAFFGMETTKYELVERVLQMKLGLSTHEIERKFDKTHDKYDEEFVEKAREILRELKGIVNITYRISINELPQYLMALAEWFKKPVGAVVIDYLGLLKNLYTRNDYQKITENMQALSELAVGLQIPILNLQTIGRSEVKDKKKLDMFSGKGSGEIEGSSKIIITLQRVEELDGKYPKSLHDEITAQKKDLLEMVIHKKKQGYYANTEIEFDKTSLLMTEYHGTPNTEGKPF